jgi:hypothetical protein
MEALFQKAATHRCSRVEWTTDSGNISAQAFYEALAPANHPSKVFYGWKPPAKASSLCVEHFLRPLGSGSVLVARLSLRELQPRGTVVGRATVVWQVQADGRLRQRRSVTAYALSSDGRNAFDQALLACDLRKSGLSARGPQR